MRLTWRQRLHQEPQWWDFHAWPTLSRDSVPTRFRSDYLRNQQMLSEVLGGDRLSDIAQRHQVSPGRITQLMDRCLGGRAETAPRLTEGLIPYRQVETPVRVAPLPTRRKRRGTACAFQALLDHVPRLREQLDAMIEAKLKDKATAQTLSPFAFHGLFKHLLTEAHWPQDRYPYTEKSLAYESVRRYLHQRTAELIQARQQRRQPPPRDLGVRPKVFRAQHATQIDEHVLDAKSTVHLELNDDLLPLRQARPSVITSADVGSTCVLGFHLVPTRTPDQVDMLTLLDTCLQPWQPMTLTTPGLSYAPGAAFPSGLPNAFPISFGMVQMDNALMHRARSVINVLCERYGGTLSCGLPGMPEIRSVVESVFAYINHHVSHRFASTTGSYPTDPKKESRKNAKQPPVVTWQILLEALSVLLSEYNITPKASLGGYSPLEIYQAQCSNHFVRYVPPLLAQQWQPLLREMILPVHWYRHQNRLPFVNFWYERYKGEGLLRVASKAKRIRVGYHMHDIRSLQAYTLEGEPLGTLNVSTPWQRYAHSITTRRHIHQLTKTHRLNARDPLAGYFQYCLENKKLPNSALTLLRVYTEFTRNQQPGLVLGDSPVPAEIITSSSKPTHRYRWDSSQADHRD